jgi:hypothetical protein
LRPSENLTVGHRLPLMYPASNNRNENLIRQCGGKSGRNGCNRLQHVNLHHSIYTDKLAKWYPFWFGPDYRSFAPGTDSFTGSGASSSGNDQEAA